MKRSLFLIFIVLPYVFITMPLKAQVSNRVHEQLRFKYITIDEGINNNRVRALGQDKYGFIWIGTQFGISRFDGYAIKQYNTYLDSIEVEFRETREFLTDRNGTLWACGVYGICYLDRTKDRFLKFKPAEIEQDITQCNGMDIDKDGYIWFGTNRGLLKYHPAKNETHLFVQDDNNPNVPPRGNLFKVIVTSKNHVWYCMESNGAGYYDQGSGVFTHFVEGTGENTLAELRTERVYEDKSGNIWIGHNNLGVSKYSYATKQFTRYYPEEGKTESGRVRGIIEDSQGNFWLGTQAGLYLFDKFNETFRLYANTDHPVSTLSHNSIQTLMVDKQEGLWIGTFAGGVSYSNLNSSGIVHYEYSNIPSEYFLNDKSIYSLCFDKNDNIWVGSENGGLNFLDRSTGKFTYFKEGEGLFNTRSNNIKDIYVDNQGLVWFGTYKGGMSYYNPGTGKFRHYQQREGFPQGIEDQSIFLIWPDAVDDNKLWVGTTNRLVWFDKTKEIFTHVTPENVGFSNVPNIRRVFDACTTSDNKMIFGADRFILIADPYKKEFNTIESVEGVNIAAADFVFLDKWENVWAGVNDHALVRCNLKTDENIYIDLSKKIQATLIEGINDDDGNIWLSSTKGLWKLEGIITTPDSFKVYHYARSDNLQSLEFIYHSQAKSAKGEILFGGINGFNSFYPEKVIPNPYVPNVIVTRLDVVGDTVEVGEKVFGKVLLTKPIMETKKLRFHHKARIFTFHFTGFHFVAPENNRFRYKLEGYDDDWVYTTASIRQAQYSNIPRGNYVFKVDASNNNGRFSEKPFEINIKVIPPFYLTIWFLLIIAVIVTLLVLAFIRWREQQLKRDKEILEEKLRKGEEEINKNKEEVAIQSEELRKRDIAEREQRWVNQGMIKISDVITNHKKNTTELCKFYLNGVIDYLEVQQGAIFTVEDGDDGVKFLKLVSAYALNKNRLKQNRVEIGENLVGACFKDNERKIIDEIPDGYADISSGIGSAKPRFLALVPLKDEDVSVGVIEISSVNKLMEYQVSFLEKISEMFASNYFSTKTSQKIELMFQQSQQQAEEMKAQEEEMRQNMEEMHATAEEAARRENELMLLNEEMKSKERNFQKAIKEKEKAMAKAREIIERQEKEIEALKKNLPVKTDKKTKS